MEASERYSLYNNQKCWQRSMRESLLHEDLRVLGKNEVWMSSLRVSNFTFKEIKLKGNFNKIKEFILKYEWLQKMPTGTSHCFIAEYGTTLAGVILIGTPYRYSANIKDSNLRERVITRGACASWTPKNLASSLIMYSIKEVAKNTPYKFFTAYADPEAKELGTIYQACNFLYLGKNSNQSLAYKDPLKPELGWISGRTFSRRRYYQRYAKELGIDWLKEWSKKPHGINWSLIPDDIEKKLRDYGREYRKNCETRESIPKHRYLYIMGKDRGETKFLRKEFISGMGWKELPEYPKIRGA